MSKIDVPVRPTIVARDAFLAFFVLQLGIVILSLFSQDGSVGGALFLVYFVFLYFFIGGFFLGTLVGFSHPVAFLWPGLNLMFVILFLLLCLFARRVDSSIRRVALFVLIYVAYVGSFSVLIKIVPSPVFTLTSPTPW